MKAGVSMRGLLSAGWGTGAVLLVAVLAGCSSVGNMLGSSSADKPVPIESASGPAAAPPSSEAIPPKDSLTNMILGKPATGEGAADQAFKQEDLPCPEITVRPGAATLVLSNKGSAGEATAMDLRYQGTLIRFARDCKTAAGVMTMKIGIEGRVIVGPAGGPGQVEVPVRLAVVQEGPSPKTVLSKLARISVTVGGDGAVDFTHVDPDVAFPLPRPLAALEQYVVYVGFDPTAVAPKKPAPRRKR
jgi:hypothetical protein